MLTPEREAEIRRAVTWEDDAGKHSTPILWQDGRDLLAEIDRLREQVALYDSHPWVQRADHAEQAIRDALDICIGYYGRASLDTPDEKLKLIECILRPRLGGDGQ